jgi:flagellar basal-body rod protein FlgB
MSGLIDRTTLFLSRALDGLTARQGAISANLANIDTPGYRPKSIDFETALRNELDWVSSGAPGNALPPSGGPSADVALKTTDSRHFAALADGSTGASYTTSTVNENLRNDTNTVDLETEMTALTETQIKYSANSRLISGKFAQLYDVLGGH